MALSMAVTVVTFFREMGVDVTKSIKDASNWVEENPDDWEELMQEVQKVGLPFGIMTQLPDDLKAIIMRELKNSFSQEYWGTISDTTKDDVITYLMQGIERGWSIDKMASKMAEVFQGTGTYQYARMRARRIAITEVGNALNGARKESTAIIQQEIPQAGIRQMWMSILSDTTRDTHANLDGVPEDENGMWNLAGINIPWPAHYTLPAKERCNCRCTITAEFGISDEEAQQLINEYWERVNEVIV